ncbi:hypothetical protein N7468_004633 [Penicillium chermesinum]|uniref:Uncharacterized protein n=1 Tax=Penicillium chermesinum TaxID=63820 RepID=A0A9W9P8X7_9EURO|nr:uncharacterized protein N7468_004633 [Penicillium chermesinum]KAJ5240014.1 hypothetical protein N7468_004633 [Penicillium chermesinum]
MPFGPQLVAGLRKATLTRELQPGEAYLVRFKNSCRGYKTDIWLGIIMPEPYAAEHLNRRPQEAKSTDGIWSVKPAERTYPLYMPGRNSYRWANVHDIFQLEEALPRIFSDDSGREGTDVFKKLHRIANGKPACHFWELMADLEVQTKGKRSRELSLVLPEGCEALVNSDEDQQQEEGSEPDEHPPAKIAASQSSFSASRNKTTQTAEHVVHVSFPGEKNLFAIKDKQNSPKRHPILHKRKPKPKAVVATSSFPRTDVSFKAEATAHSSAQQPSTVFTMNLMTVIESFILQKEVADEVFAIFEATVSLREPELGKLRSFLASKEFTPRMTLKTLFFADTSIGDILRIGRSYELKDVADAEDLSVEIISLGNLYAQARRYNMRELIADITLKLQVAWNSYPGLSQLGFLLEVTSLAFEEDIQPPYNGLQEWLLNFMADAFDLFTYACSEPFWQVLHADDGLKEAVFTRRADNMKESPTRYIDIPALLRSRGI